MSPRGIPAEPSWVREPPLGSIEKEAEGRAEEDDGTLISDQSISYSRYREENKGSFVLLSRTQAGPGRTVKQDQEEISRNHVQTFICLSVLLHHHTQLPT